MKTITETRINRLKRNDQMCMTCAFQELYHLDCGESTHVFINPFEVDDVDFSKKNFKHLSPNRILGDSGQLMGRLVSHS